MKCKKLLSVALAVCMTFGSAALLPENSFVNSTGVIAGAEKTQRETIILGSGTPYYHIDGDNQYVYNYQGRIETAVNVSKQTFSKADTVFIATTLNFADSMCSVPLAVAYNAPILYSNSSELPSETIKEIKRLGATKAIILGDTFIISDNVKDELLSNGLNVERIMAKNRFDMSVKIAEKLQQKTGEVSSELFIANGFDFVSSNYIGSIAAIRKAPILVTRGGIDKEITNYLNRVKSSVKCVYIAGGKNVIGDKCVDTIVSNLSDDVKVVRFGEYDSILHNIGDGDDDGRLGQPVSVSEYFSKELTGNGLCVATAYDYSDALVGGVMAAVKKIPLLLVPREQLGVKQTEYIINRDFSSLYVLSGNSFVPDNLIELIHEIKVSKSYAQPIKSADVKFSYGNYDEPVRDYSFHYSDAMLVGKDANANNESADIAVFSANLAVAAYEKDSVVGCLNQMGFGYENIKYSETYDFMPTYKDNDRVAYTIAYKKVNGKHLFVVPIRGTHGNCEWFSDFNLGTGKNHAGFYAAAKRVRTTLISEMKNRNADSSNTVLYFTGHSRGAAVANILAGEFSTNAMDLNGYSVDVPTNQIFAYTYACPAVSRALSSKDTALKNIYNYINPGDLIPALPLEEKGWDYKRYGRKITYEMSGDSFCDFLHRFYDFYTNEDGEKQAYQGVKDTDKLIEVFKTLASTPAELNQKSTRAILDAALTKMLNDDPKYIPTTLEDIEQQIANKYNLSLTEIYKSVAKITGTLGTALSPRMVLSGITVFNLKKAITHGHTGETYVKWTEAKYNTRKDITHKFSSFTSGFLAALGYSTNKCTICGKEVVINYQPGAISNAVKNAGKDFDLTFHRCDEDDKTYGLFKGVEIDGNTVDPSNYSTKSGSLKLTLDKAYISKLSTGTHNVKVLFEDGFSETSIFVAENANEPTVDRLAGKGRYETATKISSKAYGFETASTVVLAYGLNYADALAGVSLAKAMNAPILLTNLKTLPNETLVEIKRLGASNVIILGGTGAVGEEVEKILKENNLNVERIAGKTRFETATKIAQKMQKLNDNKAPKEVFFVYAFNSADALSVSAVAALKNAPIIYLTTKGDLNADTAAYLAKLKKAGCVKNAYVIGGEGVISNDMATKAAKALGLKKATRIAGKDRFATCVAVNEKFADVLNGDMICVATGMDFPDALAGGVYAALNKAPLFLINGKLKTPKLTDEQKAYLKTKAAGRITAFGGVGVVPDNHIEAIAKAS